MAKGFENILKAMMPPDLIKQITEFQTGMNTTVQLFVAKLNQMEKKIDKVLENQDRIITRLDTIAPNGIPDKELQEALDVDLIALNSLNVPTEEAA